MTELVPTHPAAIGAADHRNHIEILRVIKPTGTSVSLGSKLTLASQRFTCLQFCHLVCRLRLSFSPRLLSLWRNIGDIRAYALLLFLNDGWGIEKDRQVCSSIAKAVKADLGAEAGFVTNDDKSIWGPCQRLDWSGITWDSALETTEISDRRFDN